MKKKFVVLLCFMCGCAAGKPVAVTTSSHLAWFQKAHCWLSSRKCASTEMSGAPCPFTFPTSHAACRAQVEEGAAKSMCELVQKLSDTLCNDVILDVVEVKDSVILDRELSFFMGLAVQGNGRRIPFRLYATPILTPSAMTFGVEEIRTDLHEVGVSNKSN